MKTGSLHRVVIPAKAGIQADKNLDPRLRGGDGSVYGYEPHLAKSGLEEALPPIETWPNQYRGYEIKIECPEFTSICPKTKLPDFGTLILRYQPDKLCVELKSFKYYLLSYRNRGIFYENAVNRILDDIVKATRPAWAVLEGVFTTRGGMHSTITARYPRKTKGSGGRGQG